MPNEEDLIIIEEYPTVQTGIVLLYLVSNYIFLAEYCIDYFIRQYIFISKQSCEKCNY
jgi:hypothetical protein